MLFSFLHICNDPDSDKRSLPDACIPLASGPDEDDDDNIVLSSFGLFVSLAQSCSFFEFLFLVVTNL